MTKIIDVDFRRNGRKKSITEQEELSTLEQLYCIPLQTSILAVALMVLHFVAMQEQN